MLVMGAPTNRSKSVAAAKKSSSTAKGTKAAGHASSSKAAAVSSSRSARAGKGRRTAFSRAVRVPPPPSYQLHPDPERYQQIQQALADRGYFKGEANGTWGDDSVDALRRFQTDQKLPDDGKITALSLTGLGLGPRHDGSTATTVPLQPVPDTPTETTPPPAEPPRQ